MSQIKLLSTEIRYSAFAQKFMNERSDWLWNNK
jgi:hypothetical protein